MSKRSLFVALGLMTIGGVAWAQSGPVDASSTPSASSAPNASATPAMSAEELFRAAEDCYKRGEFVESAELLERAHQLKPEPVLLYNIARAYEGAGALPRAIEAYHRYLAANPSTPERASIETRIATLEKEQEDLARLERDYRASRDKLAREQAKERDHLADQARAAKRTPPEIVIAVGAAGLIAGGVLGAIALERHGAAQQQIIQREAASDQQAAKTLAVGSDVALTAGGAVAAIGIGWLLAAIVAKSPASLPEGIRPIARSRSPRLEIRF